MVATADAVDDSDDDATLVRGDDVRDGAADCNGVDGALPCAIVVMIDVVVDVVVVVVVVVKVELAALLRVERSSRPAPRTAHSACSARRSPNSASSVVLAPISSNRVAPTR